MLVYLDNAASTPLFDEVKKYIIELLDVYYNPSSIYRGGIEAKRIITNARDNVAKFINANPEKIIFTSSGSASNSLVIKGVSSENQSINKYKIFYSPTAHKSMIEASKSCLYNESLKVDKYGYINLEHLEYILSNSKLKPFVCVEFANSEIGTINNIIAISKLVHQYNGILLADATGYIPSFKIDIASLENIDFLSFSGHKLGALKGIGVLYINKKVTLKPLIYGSQEKSLFAGTENIIGIASLGKAVENYDYSSIKSTGRNYIYKFIKDNIPDSYLVGAALENRLPNNLYMCFKGIQGQSLVTLLDLNGIQVSTGSACASGSLLPSTTLTAIGMYKNDIHNCIRLSFSGKETNEELNYVCKKIKECVEQLRHLNN